MLYQLFENLVSEFWRLDKNSTSIQSKISDWAVKYNTIAVISALDSEKLVSLGQKVYQLIDQAKRLKLKRWAFEVPY